MAGYKKIIWKKKKKSLNGDQKRMRILFPAAKCIPSKNSFQGAYNKGAILV